MTATYKPISTQTLGTAVATVTFSSIPASYTDLVLIANSSTTTVGSSEINILRFNSDSTSSYSTTTLGGNGSSAQSFRSSTTYIRAGRNTANGESYFVPNKIQIMNYANTATYKTAIAQGPEADAYVEVEVGTWRSNSAITSVSLTAGLNNYKVGSTFTLYGIKAE
jgi:hypothetical protein